MQEKVWNKSFTLCFLVQSVYMLSFNMITPLIAQYVEILGGTTAIAGFIAGIFSLLALVYRPFVGFFSDRHNKKIILAFSSLLGCITIAGYGFSTSYYMVAAFRVAHALSLCILTTLSAVVACQYLPHSRMAEGIGYIGMGTTLGISLGPGIGVFLSQNFGHPAAFFVGAALLVVGTVFVLALPAQKKGEAKTGKLSLGNLIDLPSIPLTLTMATISYCTGLTTSFLVIVGEDRGLAEIALFFFVSSAGIAVTRPVVGRYTDKHGIGLLVPVAIVCEIACMVILAFSQSMVWIVVASLFRVMGQGSGQSVLQGQVLKSAPEETRSRASATFYIGVDIGQGFGAIIGGLLAGAFSYAVAFGSAVPALLLGAIPFICWVRQQQRDT